MTQSELDSMPVGWSHNDYHARMVKISDDQYALYDNYGNSTVGSGQWLCAMTGNVPGVLSSIAGTYTGGALGVWPPQPTITTQEKKELEQLEEDRKAFIKHNRLSKFKLLPKHLRQEIVDEGYIRDLAASLAGEDDSGFPDLARLNSLRAKNNHHLSGMLSVSSVYLGGLNEVTYTKFGDILKHFKTEELAKAHAEACLEEEINN